MSNEQARPVRGFYVEIHSEGVEPSALREILEAGDLHPGVVGRVELQQDVRENVERILRGHHADERAIKAALRWISVNPDDDVSDDAMVVTLQ